MNMFEVVGYLAIVWLIGCIVFLPCYAIVWYFVSMKNNKIPMSSDSVWVNGVNIHHDTNGNISSFAKDQICYLRGGIVYKCYPPETLGLKPLRHKDLRQAGARPEVVSCLVATTQGECSEQIPCQTLYKRFILFWHEKLFREISFLAIAKGWNSRYNTQRRRKEEKEKGKENGRCNRNNKRA